MLEYFLEIWYTKMNIFLTFFLMALIFAATNANEMGVENVKGVQETEQIKGVNGEVPQWV